jgi:integrative and conjugative element protein (TIGR02256 family)
MNFWSTVDRRVLLSLDDEVLKVFTRFAQTNVHAPESGGILLGRVRGENLEVIEATYPTLWDRGRRFFFERSEQLHQEIARKRWEQTYGTVRYLGEWHTHPEDYPRPSSTDRTEWLKLTRTRQDNRPMLAVIVGRKSLYVELVAPQGPSQTLSPMDDRGLTLSSQV